jgi:hypothetical protein
MNDRAWFPLCVRGVGLLLAGVGAPRLIDQIVRTGEWLHGVSSTGWTWFGVLATCGYLAAAASQVALGVYLALGGREVVAWMLADDAARCPACQYDLRGVEGRACPGCGRVVDQVGSAAPHSGQVPGGEVRQS